MSEFTESTRLSKIAAAIRLSRWREHVPFTIPLTLVGSLLAIAAASASVDWRAFAVVAANMLSMSFAFVINDIEDAQDDALDADKKSRNVISSGILSKTWGSRLAVLACSASLLLYGVSGVWTLVTGGATLALCYLYSAHPFRLKARPVTDVLSHALMLSGLLMMTGYFAYHHDPQMAWLVLIAASLFSAYGQFYNQVDDYEVDKEAGLSNTVVFAWQRPYTALGIRLPARRTGLHGRCRTSRTLSRMARNIRDYRLHHGYLVSLGTGYARQYRD